VGAKSRRCSNVGGRFANSYCVVGTPNGSRRVFIVLIGSFRKYALGFKIIFLAYAIPISIDIA